MTAATNSLDFCGDVITTGTGHASHQVCTTPLAIEEGKTYVIELDGRKKPLTLTCECSGREAFRGLRQVIYFSGHRGAYIGYRDFKGSIEICLLRSSRRIGTAMSITPIDEA